VLEVKQSNIYRVALLGRSRLVVTRFTARTKLSWDSVVGAMSEPWQARTKLQKGTKLRQLRNKAKVAAKCTASWAVVVDDDGGYKREARMAK